jgi:hypothetical protein
MPKHLRLSDLSPARQTLVRLCQDLNFGQIVDLVVADGEPSWNPGPTIRSDVRLDIEEAVRPEAVLPNFRLSSEIQRLMCHLDQLKDGKIEQIDVRAGLPRRLIVTSRPA